MGLPPELLAKRGRHHAGSRKRHRSPSYDPFSGDVKEKKKKEKEKKKAKSRTKGCAEEAITPELASRIAQGFNSISG